MGLVRLNNVPANASQQAGAVGPVRANRTSIFLGVKLMFVGVMNFGQIKKIRFVLVKIFWSNSNQFSVILIGSSELASFYSQRNVHLIIVP